MTAPFPPSMSAEPADAKAARDALAGRLFEAAAATFDMAAVYVGDRLGLYRALEASGPATSAELVARTGHQERSPTPARQASGS